MKTVTKKKRPVHLDTEDKCVARKLLRRGQSVELVAAVFGVSFWTISNLAKEAESRRGGRGDRFDAHAA